MAEIEAYTETEENIFEAALEVFSRKGKDGARMQEIADRAGINKAMLHYYFRSKDRLYEAVFEYVFQHFMLALSEAIAEETSFKETLRVFVEKYIEFHHHHPAVMRLWVHENLAGAPVVRQKLQEYGEKTENAPPYVFMRKMQQAIDAGEIRAVDPFQTFVTIIGASVFYFLAFPTMSVLNPAIAEDRDAAIEDRKAHLFDVLYHGLKA